MFHFFSQPYPFENSIYKRVLVAIGVSFFVFVFLFVFKPFELAAYPKSLLLLTIGYGLVTFFVMMLLNLLMLFTFPTYFTETNWTTAKEIFWMLILISLIGLGNTAFTILIGVGDFSFKSVMLFEMYTLSIGFFPVSVSIMINHARLKSNFEKSSQELNIKLDAINEKDLIQAINDQSIQLSLQEKINSITLTAENGKDQHSFFTNDLLFLKSADNYVEVYYLDKDKTTSSLIRTTLKQCEETLKSNKAFFRCHKSYLVHLNKVNHVSGNAQGYKLHLKNTDEIIPVSRLHNESIKKYFSVRP